MDLPECLLQTSHLQTGEGHTAHCSSSYIYSLLPRHPLESLEARLCDCSASMFTLSGAMKPFVLRLCFNQNLQS